jgi:hypothetical protein
MAFPISAVSTPSFSRTDSERFFIETVPWFWYRTASHRRAESELERHLEDTRPGYLERRSLLSAAVLGSASELLQFHERAEFHRDRSDLYWRRRDPAADAVSRLGDIQDQVLVHDAAVDSATFARSLRVLSDSACVPKGHYESSPVRSAGNLKRERVRPDRDDRNDLLFPNRATIHRSSLAGRVILKRTPPQHFVLGYFHCVPSGQPLS